MKYFNNVFSKESGEDYILTKSDNNSIDNRTLYNKDQL